ncbi:sugar 3,4-ketoisomerase [Namhaeicola litoreus]|uniref:FdtA/QdtA family cupin domain-containing protein n=1 Tax=Namhaeicola litoreus TaxID=1052145 RepID=A0ABW3Y728_9FLAO
MYSTKIIELPRLLDPRGNLSFFEDENQIPFKIKRAYWIYDVPGGGKRGLYAFRKSEVFIIAMSGSFDIVINNGPVEFKYSLNRSYYGLYIPPMNWLKMENFSTNSQALVVSSIIYDENDYIRDFEVFKKEKDEIRKQYRL